MKYDYLREVPVKDRPKKIATWEKEFFANRKYLPWLVLASLPGLASAGWNAFVLSRWAWASFGLASTELLAVIGFTTVCSGMSSSNWGTYFKDLEPFNYWLDMMLIVGGYIFVMTGMWMGP